MINYKNKNTIIIILVSILILGFFSWYFLIKQKNSDKISQETHLTNQQKLNMLATTPKTPIKFISNNEKKKILNEININKKPVGSISNEEKLQLLK